MNDPTMWALPKCELPFEELEEFEDFELFRWFASANAKRQPHERVEHVLRIASGMRRHKKLPVR